MRSSRAQEILTDEEVIAFVEDMKQELRIRWENSETPEDREQCFIELDGLKTFFRNLRKLADNRRIEGEDNG